MDAARASSSVSPAPSVASQSGQTVGHGMVTRSIANAPQGGLQVNGLALTRNSPDVSSCPSSNVVPVPGVNVVNPASSSNPSSNHVPAVGQGAASVVGADGRDVVACMCKGKPCPTCHALANPNFLPRIISCPFPSCEQHNKNFYLGSGSPEYKWDQLMPLRKHIVSEHAKSEIIVLGEAFLFKHWRIGTCSKPMCGGVGLVNCNSKAMPPGGPNHLCCAEPRAQRAPASSAPAASRAPPLGQQQTQVHGSVVPWLVEFIYAIQAIGSIEDLPPCPSIIRELPTRSTPNKAALSQLFRDFTAALKIQGLSQLDRVNVLKAFSLVWRVLGLAPCKDEFGEEVAQTVGFGNRLHALMYKTGGPMSLWRDHCNVAAVGANSQLRQQDQSNWAEERKAQARIDEAERCLDGADVGRAFKALTSEKTPKFLTPAKATEMLGAKYGGLADNRCAGQDDAVYRLGMQLLDQAKVDGKVTEAELASRLTVAAVRDAVASATRMDSADQTGVRPFFIKQLLHHGQALLDSKGQEDLVYLMSVACSVDLPREVVSFFLSWGMFCLHDQAENKDRIINPPFTIAAIVYRTEASLSRSGYRRLFGNFQVAGGLEAGGEQIKNLVDMLCADEAPRHGSAPAPAPPPFSASAWGAAHSRS